MNWFELLWFLALAILYALMFWSFGKMNYYRGRADQAREDAEYLERLAREMDDK